MAYKNYFLILALLLCLTACATAHSNEIVAEGETPVKVADSYSFTEGPAADAKGDVYFTDQPNNKIYRWDCESGEITLFTDQSGRSTSHGVSLCLTVSHIAPSATFKCFLTVSHDST